MSLSLSELIYGSQGLQNQKKQPPLTPPPSLPNRLDQDKPRKGPVLRSQTSRKRKLVKIEAEEEEVDRYYNKANESSDSLSKQIQPKKRTKYDFETNVEDRLFYGSSSKVKLTRGSYDSISAKKKRIFDPISGRYISILDETEEERQRRLLKYKEKLQRYKRLTLTAKWNFRQEIDVGSAMKYMADRGRKMDKQGDDIRPIQTRKKMGRMNTNRDRVVGNEKTKELKGALHSRRQLDNLISRTKSIDDRSGPSTSDARQDPSHALHYVWLGYCAPFWRQLGGSYFASLKKMYSSTSAPSGKEQYVILMILLNTFTRHPQDFKVSRSRCIMPKVLCIDKSQYLRNDLAIKFWNLTHDYDIRKCPEVYHSRRKVFLRQRLSEKNISGESIEEEAKQVLSVVSRYVSGCGSLSSSPGRYEQHLEHMLRLLHNMSTSIDHTRSVVRQSQTVASNCVLWNEVYPKMKLLCSKGMLDLEDFFIIRKELLSSFSEFFSDPCMTANYEDCSHIGERRRHRIFDFIERISKGGTREKSSSQNPWILSHTEKLAKNIKMCDMPYSHGARYSKVVHSTPISLGTIHVTLCFLLSSLALAMVKNESTQEIIKMCEEVDDYLSKLAGAVWNKNDGNIPIKFHRLLLSAPLAYVTQMKQSYISNVSFTNSIIQDDTDFHYHHSNMEESDGMDPSFGGNKSDYRKSIDFKNVASNLASYGQLLSRDGKLEIFHQIHLTTAVATMASCFGPSGAEILSRPTFVGGVSSNTPFHLVRFSLEDAAQKGLIRRNATSISYDAHVINADALIRCFETAAEMFRDILNLIPDSIDCRCWYTATRLGAMIVASGIQIGNGSRVASPEEYNMEDYPVDDVSRHSKYNALRSLASAATRELLAYKTNSNRPPGNRYHYAIISILEWKEIVGLLIKRPHLNMGAFKTIRLLHAMHTSAWAMDECSDEALAYVMTLAQDGFVSHRDVLDILTKVIDRNPNNVRAWATLASALTCAPHSSLRAWVYQIIPHWKTHYFTVQSDMVPRPQLSSTVALTAARSHLLNSILRYDTPINQNSTKTTAFWSSLKRDVQYELNNNDKDWLWPTTLTDEDEDDHMEWINDDGEMILLDEYLPNLGQGVKDLDISCFDDIPIEQTNELLFLASKAIVANALYGQCAYVNFVVDFLVHKGATRTTTTTTTTDSDICIDRTSDAIKLLELLNCSKMVDIIPILNDLCWRSHNQVQNKKSKKRKFPFRFETF